MSSASSSVVTPPHSADTPVDATSESITASPTSAAGANRPLQQQQRRTVVVFHPGSFDLKIGLHTHDDEHPHTVPHCVAFPKHYFTSQQYRSRSADQNSDEEDEESEDERGTDSQRLAFMEEMDDVDDDDDESQMEQKRIQEEKEREKQLLAIRRDLLVSRGIIRSKSTVSSSSDTLDIPEEKEVYFEEIALDRNVDTVKGLLQRQKTSFRSDTEDKEERRQILNFDLEHRELELLDAQEDGKNGGAGIDADLKPLVGQHALDTLALGDNDQKYDLYRPMWGGHLNVPHKTTERRWSQDMISHAITLIWKHALRDILKMSNYQIQRASAVLVVPDMMHSLEVELLLDVLFKELRFKEVLVHVESVCATFGAGVQYACVLDIGLSKTTVTVVEEGIAHKKSRIYMPIGTDDMTRCLTWILLQCGFPLNEILDISRQRNRALMDAMRERYCTLEHGKGRKEHFQTVKFAFRGNIYSVDIGDPLFIAALGFFYPKLFLPHRMHQYNVSHLFKVEQPEENVADQEELERIANDPIVNAVLKGNWSAIPVETSHSLHIAKERRGSTSSGRAAASATAASGANVARSSVTPPSNESKSASTSSTSTTGATSTGAASTTSKTSEVSKDSPTGVQQGVQMKVKVKVDKKRPRPDNPENSSGSGQGGPAKMPKSMSGESMNQVPKESSSENGDTKSSALEASELASVATPGSVVSTPLGSDVQPSDHESASEKEGAANDAAGKNKKKTVRKRGSRRARTIPMGLKTPAIENEADIPVNAVVSLRDAVIASYQRSEMKVPIARRSKLMHINVLLVGGGAHIKHLSEKLREQLQEFYSDRIPKEIVPQVNILNNERDKFYDPRFLQYRGGLLMTLLEGGSDMWISSDKYEVYGMDRVKETVQFEFDQ